jgi:hypothetical protein
VLSSRTGTACTRINGGTLAQGGTRLVWDEHGYYDVALDANVLTRTP